MCLDASCHSTPQKASDRQPLQTKVLSSTPVQLVEGITHAARTCSPELSVQYLYLLEFCINHGSFVRKCDKGRVLRL